MNLRKSSGNLLLKSSVIKLWKMSDEKYALKPKLNIKKACIAPSVKFHKSIWSWNKPGLKTDCWHNKSLGNENIYGSFENGWNQLADMYKTFVQNDLEKLKI